MTILENRTETLREETSGVKANRNHDGTIQMTKNVGGARHSVRAAGWQPTRSAGKRPARPACRACVHQSGSALSVCLFSSENSNHAGIKLEKCLAGGLPTKTSG
jgi:hypothetical protein